MFASHIETGQIYRLNKPSEKLDLAGLGNQTVAAVAGDRQAGAFFQYVAKHEYCFKTNRCLA